MSDFKYVQPLPGMTGPCIFCNEYDPKPDVLIQKNVPGGASGLAHKNCLDEFFESEDDEEEIETI